MRSSGFVAVAAKRREHFRPMLRALAGRPLRVGYVSADFCQHTVGLFVKDVLMGHDPAKMLPFAYSAGQVDDWVTAAIRNACSFRAVSALGDAALVAQIRRDEIDVLVDLSGHTAGSRLTVFAHRPAPVQVSWLGYFATTGLPLMDAALRQSVRQAFAQRGIASERIELRGASFHPEVLRQYADIDIALDPFPFTGGLTSCEALWMGVPVITWPQRQVVSRQTFAFLSAIGLPELAAQDGDDYVRIAVELAGDRPRLAALRSGMRSRMQASPLMDVAGFTRRLEQTLRGLYRDIEAQAHFPSLRGAQRRGNP